MKRSTGPGGGEPSVAPLANADGDCLRLTGSRVVADRCVDLNQARFSGGWLRKLEGIRPKSGGIPGPKLGDDAPHSRVLLSKRGE